LRDKAAYGCEVDLWSVGVVAFVLMGGCNPFDPFGNARPRIVRQRVLSCEWSFDAGRWDGISVQAKTVLRALLEPRMSVRMTAQQLLQCEWLIDAASRSLGPILDAFPPSQPPSPRTPAAGNAFQQSQPASPRTPAAGSASPLSHPPSPHSPSTDSLATSAAPAGRPRTSPATTRAKIAADLADLQGENENTTLFWRAGKLRMPSTEASLELRTMLEAGVDPDAEDYGYSLLMNAAREGRSGDAALLLRSGADVNWTSESGNTALHKACAFGRDLVAALLLRHGASCAIVNEHGKTALDEAQSKGWQRCAALLQEPAVE